MIETIGVCAGPGTCLCRFRVGADTIEVSRSGRRLLTLLNGRAIMAAKSDKEVAERSAPVMARIISVLGKATEGIKVACSVVDRRYAARLGDVLKTIRDNSDHVEVETLEKPGDEEQDSGPKQGYPSASLTEGVVAYREHIAEVGRNISSLNHASEVLLRTHLAPHMWGGKEVTSVLGAVKSGMARLAGEADTLDAHLEHSDTGARYVQACLASGRDTHVSEAISRVTENFSSIKTYASELAQTLHGLYDIDRVFKASTGYPATWFLDSSILMDLGYEYDGLIGNMVKNASVEASVMEPLLAWKIRFNSRAS